MLGHSTLHFRDHMVYSRQKAKRIPGMLKLLMTDQYLELYKSSLISVTSLLIFYLCLGLSDYNYPLFSVFHLQFCTNLQCLLCMLYASIHLTCGQQVSSNCYNHIPDLHSLCPEDQVTDMR